MLPSPDSLPIPLKEGLRDLRSSLRREADAGDLSRRLFGVPGPSRHLARLANDVFGQVERVAVRVLPQDNHPLGERLDRLGDALLDGPRGDWQSHLYRVYREILDRMGAAGTMVSELRLASVRLPAPAGSQSDIAAATLRLVQSLRSAAVVRPCLSASLAHSLVLPSDDINERVALATGLAILVRRLGREDADAILDSASWTVEAEKAEWLPLLRQDDLETLARLWRQTASYLP